MADYVSRYTGEELDNLLQSISNKLSKDDIVTIWSNDPDYPGAASLSYQLKEMVDALALSVSQNSVTLTGTQRITGEKTFSNPIKALKGMEVPADYYITQTSEPLLDTQVANRSFVRKHGLDSDSVGTGLKARQTVGGYIGFDIDLTTLPPLPADQSETYRLIVSGEGGIAYIYSTSGLFEGVFTDDRWVNFQLQYATDLSNTNAALGDRVLVSTYTIDQTAVNTALTGKVSNTTYTPKMQEIDLELASRVKTVTYAADQSAINTALSARVLLTDYNARNTSVDTSLADRVSFTVDGTVSVPANTTSNVFTVPKSEALEAIVSCVIQGIAKPVVHRINMTTDGTTAYLVATQLFDAGVAYTVSVSGANMLLNVKATDTTKTMTVKFKILVRY